MNESDRFQVYQVAIESILTKMLAEMPEEQVDDWLTNDSNLLVATWGSGHDDKDEFYRLVFNRIHDGVKSRRSRRQ